MPYVPVFSWYALHPTPWDPQEFTLLDKQNRPNQSYEALAGVGPDGRRGGCRRVKPPFAATNPERIPTAALALRDSA